MGFFKFIFSKTFLIQLVIAAIVIVVLAFLALRWLDYSTNQDQRIAVPDLSKQSLDVVDDQLAELDLRYEILDSANFNPDFPRYSVIEQVPEPGQFVKENRKIYLTLNPSGYRKIMIPDLIRRTRRQAEPTLRSLGFEIGDVSYKPDIAEDAVLELRHKGKKLEPGDELMKTSKIDLVLGDGSGRYRMEGEEEQDSITSEEEEIEF
ncbi:MULTISPECIES: PASTA domain-containing protein [Salegentibacter]|jgi:beta-lactam-binding protein with PASTA domain|uniref:PASTA domain-containing protein n=1 Tax=Salegentibacter agarivorans TaxID=345907 RepID=A0A1I2L4R7_9FLAO|nr:MULTISPECIES: PASTA domain-containing protein [Salegentibacter]APS40354.1 serine/threonine protein kinase [Salegentibacter sp. T436]MBO2545870.1 PASTA domain-containing protein [Salegentibacter sp. BDJ18]SFF72447.1 PASTA domain-containing protein [Salegentibacter agarivorans]|tara:strand:+ start:377 stop:994 length:618 start_codon:yes stop_codon:yes gene_type:complete